MRHVDDYVMSMELLTDSPNIGTKIRQAIILDIGQRSSKVVLRAMEILMFKKEITYQWSIFHGYVNVYQRVSVSLHFNMISCAGT